MAMTTPTATDLQPSPSSSHSSPSSTSPSSPSPSSPGSSWPGQEGATAATAAPSPSSPRTGGWTKSRRGNRQQQHQQGGGAPPAPTGSMIMVGSRSPSGLPRSSSSPAIHAEPSGATGAGSVVLGMPRLSVAEGEGEGQVDDIRKALQAEGKQREAREEGAGAGSRQVQGGISWETVPDRRKLPPGSTFDAEAFNAVGSESGKSAEDPRRSHRSSSRLTIKRVAAGEGLQGEGLVLPRPSLSSTAGLFAGDAILSGERRKGMPGMGPLVMDRIKSVILEAVSNGAPMLDLSEQDLIYLPGDVGLLNLLEELNLERNALASLPQEIGQLCALDTLQLYRNELATLPPEIGKLSNLTRLFVNNNQLMSLPPEIGQLTNLIWLSLDRNRLGTLPKEIGLLQNLTWLSIEDNNLSSLPLQMGVLYNLRSLSILNNAELTNLPQAIISLKNLSDFRCNQFFELPKDITSAGSATVMCYLLDMQRLEAPLNPACVTSHWVPDDTVAACKNCSSTFSKLTRRHHCRLCGSVFCSKCTSKRLPIAQLYYFNAVRVCGVCENLLSNHTSPVPALTPATEDDL